MGVSPTRMCCEGVARDDEGDEDGEKGAEGTEAEDEDSKRPFEGCLDESSFLFFDDEAFSGIDDSSPRRRPWLLLVMLLPVVLLLLLFPVVLLEVRTGCTTVFAVCVVRRRFKCVFPCCFALAAPAAAFKVDGAGAEGATLAAAGVTPEMDGPDVFAEALPVPEATASAEVKLAVKLAPAVEVEVSAKSSEGIFQTSLRRLGGAAVLAAV